MDDDTMAAEGCQQLQGSKAAVPDQHQLAPGQPSAGLQDQLAGPVGEPFVSAAMLRQNRSEGAGAVRKGSAQTRPAQGMGARSIRLSQRRPEAFAKLPWEERTGSR